MFKLLMLESGVRGLHAAGIWSSTSGLTRCAGDVYDFISGADIKPANILLGHTRYSTSGDFCDIENNQPLQQSDLVLAHNGIVSMSEDFDKIFGQKCSTRNDSEVILRKIAALSLRSNLVSAIPAALSQIGKVSKPIFACVLVDSEQDQVYLFHDDIRPLHLYWVQALNCHVWTSTADIMRRACKYQYEEVKLKPFQLYQLSEGWKLTTMGEIDLEPQEVMSFINTPTLIQLSQVEATEAVTRDTDYRMYRRQGFVDYYVSIIKSWDVDPAYPMMRYMIERYELSREQQYWMMWLYGVFYHVASVHWVMQEFPDFELVDLDRLQKWHDKHWKLLQYETDRRHEKSLFVDRFKSYKEWVGDSTQEARFVALLDPECNPYTSYTRVNKELGKLRGFGRYALFYYTEALARCVGLPILCTHIPLKDCDSSRNGLCHALKREDLVDAQDLTKEEYQWLEQQQNKLMKDIQRAYPSIPVDFWYMETAECAFKGLFRRRRYIGYYIDRLYEEIVAIETKDKAGVTSGVCWSVLEDFRQECLDPRYVNQSGINQRHLHILLDEGELVLIHPNVFNSALEFDELEVPVDLPIKDNRKYKVVSKGRKMDTLKSPYLNWKVLGCQPSQQVVKVIQARKVKP